MQNQEDTILELQGDEFVDKTIIVRPAPPEPKSWADHEAQEMGFANYGHSLSKMFTGNGDTTANGGLPQSSLLNTGHKSTHINTMKCAGVLNGCGGCSCSWIPVYVSDNEYRTSRNQRCIVSVK